MSVAEQMATLMGEKVDITLIWNDHCQVDLVNTAKYFIYYTVVSNFFKTLHGKKPFNCSKTLKDYSEPIQQLMTRLYRVYGLYFMLEEFESFY
jgi:hypothetical protein